MLVKEEAASITYYTSQVTVVDRVLRPACVPAWQTFSGAADDMDREYCDTRSVRMLCFPSGQQIVILFCRRALIKCRRTEEETIEINVWSHTCRRLLPPNLWPKTYTMQSRQSQQNTAPDDDSGVLVFFIYPTKVNEKKRLTLIAPPPFSHNKVYATYFTFS